MSTLLVTGGAGFIGSNFIHYWMEQHPDDNIVNLDALTYAGNPDNVREAGKTDRYTFVEGDICNAELVTELAEDADVIVHFAAESHVDRSILGPGAFVETNIKGTFVLLEAARARGIHMHHISTDEVFGALELDSGEEFNERTPYNPRSPYAASKASSDHLVRAYAETYNLAVTITNCSNNFGPFQYPEKFLPRMITNLIDGENVKIYGDGKYVRDWLYVADHCRAIDLVLNKGKTGETYLVGGQKGAEELNNLDIAKKVVAHMYPDEASEEDSARIEFVTDRPGHDRRYAVDWSKIHDELGWQPEHTFDEWLERTIDWYKENEWWWRPLKEGAEQTYKTTGQ